MKELISVIMPVYNSEQYLSAAIESVLAQTYDKFELFLVDDGSTDSSGMICDTYAKKDSRIHVVHKQNGGLCSARNEALSLAQGEWVSFIDNDDAFAPFCFETCMNASMLTEQVEWIRFARKRTTVFEDGTEKDDIFGVSGFFVGGQDIAYLSEDVSRVLFAKIKLSGMLNGVWNGLYKREILEKYQIRFDERIRHGMEDWKFNLQYYQKASGILLINEAMYHYKRRISHSVSTHFSINRLESLLLVAETERELYREMKLGSYASNRAWNNAILYYVDEMCRELLSVECHLADKEKREYLDRMHTLLTRKKPSYRKAAGEHFYHGILARAFYQRKYQLLFRYQSLLKRMQPSI